MHLKLLHTADWHLGQSFHGFERDYEHAAFLDWLIQQIGITKPDVLCIAGDIYDSVNPPATAQRRFFNFLANAHTCHPPLQIILIAGNHDAAARLEAPAPLMESHNTRVVGTVSRLPDGEIDYQKLLVPLKNAAGVTSAIAILAPFLRPADLPQVPQTTDSYQGGIQEFYRRATEAAVELRSSLHPEAAIIGLGHLHMQNASESRDSERRIVIGGAEAVTESAFPESLSYVALGHLHKPQSLANGRIRYSGSPIPLSFSEKDYQHSILELCFDGESLQNATPIVTPIPIPKAVPLLRLPTKGALPIHELLLQIDETSFGDSLTPETFPFLEIRVLDDGPDPTRRNRIEKALAGKPVRLTSIRLESPSRPETLVAPAFSTITTDLANLDPEQILIEAHRERFQKEPDPSLLESLREIRQSCQL
ncbi:MAG: exonuclease subunit SbcD [Verrucomicrobiota bacterium]